MVVNCCDACRKPVKKTCPECGREFTHPAAYANHAKVCGKVRAPLTPQPLLCCPMLCSRR